MNDRAKLLLSAYRPGGNDASDPAFAEALAQAQRDPALRAWLEESQAFDRAVAERLGAMPVPADLRATILAGAKFSQPRRWWQMPKFWALAAVLAVMAVLAAFRPAAKPDAWQADSIAVLDRIEKGDVPLDTEHAQPAHLVEWLNAHAAPVPAAIPPALAQGPSLGCKSIDSARRKVSLLCFDLGNGEQAHLFTTPRDGLRLPPPDRHPIFSRMRNWNLASWSDGAQAHMLASEIAPERLRTLLPAFIAAQSPPRFQTIAELLP